MKIHNFIEAMTLIIELNSLISVYKFLLYKQNVVTAVLACRVPKEHFVYEARIDKHTGIIDFNLSVSLSICIQHNRVYIDRFPFHKLKQMNH